ncbi:MAG TPA: hypothetical protein VI138_00900 [Candidatus Dormibacteraeota bacterium]
MRRPDEVYRLVDSRNGAEVTVGGFPLQLEGDADLGQRLRGHLGDPVTTLGSSYDGATGERGTKLVTLHPGDPGWLKESLRRAARDLGLRLTEGGLGGG